MIYFDPKAYHKLSRIRVFSFLSRWQRCCNSPDKPSPLVAAKGDGTCRPIYIIAPVKEGRKR